MATRIVDAIRPGCALLLIKYAQPQLYCLDAILFDHDERPKEIVHDHRNKDQGILDGDADNRVAKSAIVPITGFELGIRMRQYTPILEQPSTIAASSISLGKLKYARGE